MVYVTYRDVVKISNRWDYVDASQVLWVTLKEKVNQTGLLDGKVKATDGYFTWLQLLSTSLIYMNHILSAQVIES